MIDFLNFYYLSCLDSFKLFEFLFISNEKTEPFYNLYYYWHNKYYENYLRIIYYCVLQNNSMVLFKYFNLVFFFKFFLKFFKLSLIIITLSLFFNLNIFLNFFKVLYNYSFFFYSTIFIENEKSLVPMSDIINILIVYTITIFFFFFNIFFFFYTTYYFFNIFIFNLILLIIIVLLIPFNLFLDLNFFFFSAIRGCANSSNIFKEFILDVISSFIILIRFILQNIRFIFIFFSIIELLEFLINNNNTNLINNIILNNNFFLNFNYSTFNFSLSNFSFFFINSFFFIILCFYYFLHLFFLLIVQNIVYCIILLWLFFFLYTSKSSLKLESFFKKN